MGAWVALAMLSCQSVRVGGKQGGRRAGKAESCAQRTEAERSSAGVLASTFCTFSASSDTVPPCAAGKTICESMETDAAATVRSTSMAAGKSESRLVRNAEASNVATSPSATKVTLTTER